MKNILIANVGSTSYKYTLYAIEGASCNELMRGGIERVENFEDAIEQGLADLKSNGFTQVDAVAFKTVLGKNLSGICEADGKVLKALEDMSFVAPAHNPSYANAIRAFEKIMPASRRVALFETSFYQWADRAWKRYAVPQAWDDAGVRRYGFHGASHKYVAQRAAELCGREDAAESAKLLYVNNAPMSLEKPFRVVSCHLGGSSSVCGILNGAAIGSSMGFSPQSGLPQNNRVGDLDTMAIPFAMSEMGLSADEAVKQLSKEGGLLGISGVSNDMRDIYTAAQEGNERAKLAIEVQAYSTRFYIGAFMAQLGGIDAISFSGGMGQSNPWLRKEILKGFEAFGVVLDEEKNNTISRTSEGIISAENSKVKVVSIVANEEIVIAREVAAFLNK